MVEVHTKLDDDVHAKLVELAGVDTKGNVHAFLSILIRQAVMGEEYEYAVLKEARLKKGLKHVGS